MREIKPNERHNILNNHKHFDNRTLSFWYDEINKRLEYLKPLFKEMKKLNIELKTVSKELNQEVFEITELKKLIEMYKVNNKLSCAKN